MVYMGSKNRIAKELIPIITKDLKPNQWYCEPFVGGANMIDKIEHPYKLGADNNKYLIALLEAVQNGQELPEHITKDEYIAVKTNKDNYPDWYVGFVGFKCIWEKQINSNLGVHLKRLQRSYLQYETLLQIC